MLLLIAPMNETRLVEAENYKCKIKMKRIVTMLLAIFTSLCASYSEVEAQNEILHAYGSGVESWAAESEMDWIEKPLRKFHYRTNFSSDLSKGKVRVKVRLKEAIVSTCTTVNFKTKFVLKDPLYIYLYSNYGKKDFQVIQFKMSRTSEVTFYGKCMIRIKDTDLFIEGECKVKFDLENACITIN